MNLVEQKNLLAEKATLEQLLSETPDDEILEVSSLQGRLDDVTSRLDASVYDATSPARVELTFRGKPVIGDHGIFAEFGAKATRLFADAIAKVAAGFAGPLKPMGPVPNRDLGQLLIVDKAIGSFGFVLEEHRPEKLLFTETATSEAIESTRNLLASSLQTDDDLADAASVTEERAVTAVRAFLELLVSNEAVCTMRDHDQEFGFRDVGEVRKSLSRLDRENLYEEVATLNGEFLGLLPEGRTFEFRQASSGEVIRGKVIRALGDAEEINQHLHESATIRVLITRVGKGHPRWTLLELPRWMSVENA